MSKHLEPGEPRSSGDLPRSRKRPDGWRRWFPYAFLASMLVFAAVCGIVAARMVATKQNFGDVVVGYFVPSPETIFGKDRIIVGLLGLDYDYTDQDIETLANARTDKLSVYALDFPTRVVKEIAVPRDMEALIRGHENKINAAYAFGGESLTDQTTGEFLGLPKNDKGRYFDRYITLRIDATKDFIDAIGGLDVNVDEEMNYDDNWGHLHIHFHPGLQHMNGDQAVSFARFRHDACSDPCRIKRQQMVMQLAIEKLKNEKFNDLTHIAQLINVIRKDVYTDFKPEEMNSLAWHFKNVSLANVKQTQIPFSGDVVTDYAGDMLVPDQKKKAEIVADFLGPYVAQTPPPEAVAAATVAPSTVHVVVQNGSGQSGLGKRMADALRASGYVVDSVGNADSFGYDTTVIREHSKIAGVGEQVRARIALKTATVTPAPQASANPFPESGDVTVIVGRDFAAAAPVATAKSAQ